VVVAAEYTPRREAVDTRSVVEAVAAPSAGLVAQEQDGRLSHRT